MVVGDKVQVKMRAYDKKCKHRVEEGIVEIVQPYYTIINNGRYKVTILAADVISGQAIINILKGAEGRRN